MAVTSVSKVLLKNGHTRWFTRYKPGQSTNEHLNDVLHHVQAPDRIGERGVKETVQQESVSLLRRARELRQEGRHDLAMNFAFGAAVMAGVSSHQTKSALSLYRGSFRELQKAEAEHAKDILRHHHDGELWAPDARYPQNINYAIDKKMLHHFRAAINLPGLRLVEKKSAVSQPPVAEMTGPDKLAVA